MEKSEAVPMSQWGRDHWSTLAYIECRCVDHKGIPNRAHMRTDIDLHPALADTRILVNMQPGKKYPTRLKDGIDKEAHDDWSCAEDMEAAGLLKWEGTGLNPVFVLTKLGLKVSAALREHKAGGGNFASFSYSIGLVTGCGVVST